MSVVPGAPCAALPLESKVAFLRQPSSYPDAPDQVDAIETHMAWVFLAGQHAYKLKKPVHGAGIDLRQVEARRHLCTEEVRLNLRLAPTVYQGVVPLGLDAQGQLQLDAGGVTTPLDWLVKMRRLPAGLMLDQLVRDHQATPAQMHAIAQRMLEFYEALPPQQIDGHSYRQRFVRQLAASRAELLAPHAGLPGAPVQLLYQRLRSTLDRLAPLFDQRAHGAKLVEGHGDLRPEHICLTPEISIIDCLEFSRALRIVDRADELAFLALETTRLGASELGAALLGAYRTLSHDRPAPALLRFYQGYRAVVRATLAIRHLHEDQYRCSPKWRASALNYLRLAQRITAPHP